MGVDHCAVHMVLSEREALYDLMAVLVERLESMPKKTVLIKDIDIQNKSGPIHITGAPPPRMVIAPQMRDNFPAPVWADQGQQKGGGNGHSLRRTNGA